MQVPHAKAECASMDRTEPSTSQLVSLEEAYGDLVEHLVQFDPLELLCNVTLRFLRQGASKFIGEADESNRWVVRVELIAGILLTRPRPGNAESKVTSPAIKQLRQLIERYEFALLAPTAEENLSSSDLSELTGPGLLGTVRNYSYWVRGTAHHHQYTEFTHELYPPHDKWFKDNLGFTIKEALALVKAFGYKYNDRINAEKSISREHAVNAVKDVHVDEECKRALELTTYAEHYFGRAHENLGISIDELTQLTHIPKCTCINILARLSQEIGYQNPKFPNTHRDPHSAPWDFNTLYERPFVRSGDRYWMILPAIIRQALMSTFYFDLMDDPDYQQEFAKARGEWLERKTADCFQRVFNHADIFLNPRYPNGNELIDMLVLHNETMFIVECKSKGLTFEADRGRSYDELKRSLQGAVKTAYEQCDRARRYLLERPQAELRQRDENLSFVIDTQRIKRIYMVIVTAAPLQALATMWASINSELELFPDGDYPWALSLADLETVTEMLPTPVRFIHYAIRRFEFTQRKWHLLADERDLLGSYFSNGLCATARRYQDINLPGLFGMSGSIDEYMYRKHSLGQDVDRPSSPEHNGLSELIEGISDCMDSNSDDVAFAVLNMSGTNRVAFMDQVHQTIDKTLKDGLLRRFVMVDECGSSALAFLAMDAHGNSKKLYSTVATFASRVMQLIDGSKFFAIAVDISTDNAVDCVFYLAPNTRDVPQ